MKRATPWSRGLGHLRLEVEDNPAPRDVAALDDRLAAVTVAAAGHGSPRPLAIFARDEGTVVGGVHGWTWGRCCELVSLWVSPSRRGHGLGRTLLTMAEDEARGRGCVQVIVFTHALQAPRLYAGAGYELVGQIEDYPSGSAAYWFRKRLDRSPGGVVRHVAQVVAWSAIGLLLIRELADGVKHSQRGAVQMVGRWWYGVERRARADARRAELAVLARSLTPRPPARRP